MNIFLVGIIGTIFFSSYAYPLHRLENTEVMQELICAIYQSAKEGRTTQL